MNLHCEKFDPNQEYFFEEGCYIIELSNSTNDEEVSIARARVEPGQQTRWHRLKDTSERYVVTHGKGLAEVGDAGEDGEPDSIELNQGDVLVVPALCRQRITNTGSEDLIFLAICSPRFDKSNYIED